MNNVQHMTQETDADAVYIKGKMAEADRLRTSAQNDITAADAADDEAGNRLVAKKTALDKGVSEAVSKGGRGHKHPFNDWLDAQGIDRETARRRMQRVGWSEEQRTEAKAKEATRKRESRKVGASTVIARATGRAVGGSDVRKVEKAMGESLKGKTFNEEEAQEFQDKAAAILNPDKAANDVAQGRASLSETMQQKYDRALAKALAEQHAAQEATFWARVREEVKQRLPKEKADALQAIKDYGLKMKGVASQMSLDDYRFVCRVLHPDRQPSEEERAKAFAIVRKLDEYITVANR